MESESGAHGWVQGNGLLSDEDVVTLTGRKFARLQCEALVAMGIPFTINVCGDPLIPLSAIEGSKAEARLDVKLIQERTEHALRDSAEKHRLAYRERVRQCTSAPLHPGGELALDSTGI